MRTLLKKMAALGICLLLAVSLAGCGAAEEETAEVEEAAAEEPAAGAVEESQETQEGHILSVRVITEVYGDGQKAAAVAVEYDAEVDMDSLEPEDYQVFPLNVSEIDEYEVTGVYTNSQAAISSEAAVGNYVIVELSTDYILSNYTAGSGGSGTGERTVDGALEEADGLEGLALEDTRTSSEMGDRTASGDLEEGEWAGAEELEASGEISAEGISGGFSMDSTSASNQIQLSITQAGDVASAGGTVYPASETAYENDYEQNINLLVEDFAQYIFTAEDGTELMYNLFLPEGYDGGETYPLVLFMPDATGSGSDPVKTLTQGLGAVVWAGSGDQEAHPAIVLAPQYNGNDSAAITMELLEDICRTYAVDTDRIYLTGQSAGTIRAIQMMIENPDYFAGAMLVAGQADDAFTDMLSQLSGQNIWMICSTGDARALPGMTAIMEAVKEAGTEVTEGAWSALDSEEEQNAAVAVMQESGAHFYCTVLSDVVPDGVSDSDVTEHMNTWRVAYSISEIRDWLFRQAKG